METISTYPIIIVGSGPTGATLSMLLSKHKIHHLIVDKAIFPRDKICGDGYTPEVPRVLREINEELYQSFLTAKWIKPAGNIYTEVNTTGFSFKYKKDDSVNLVPYYIGKRKDFDNFLVQNIPSPYAKYLQNQEVISLTRANNKALVSIKNLTTSEVQIYMCDLIVGADGERSIVKKLLHPNGIKKKQEHYIGALRCYYKNIQPISTEFGSMEVYAVKNNFPGYLWIFELPNNEFNVGIGGITKDISKGKINLKKLLTDYIEQHPVLKNRFKHAEAMEKPQGWGIPLSSNAVDYVGDNYLLIGDAGSMGEPLTGKGIGVAMFVALQAIPVIQKAISKQNFTYATLKEFEQVVEKKFRGEWKQLYWGQKLFSYHYLVKIVYTILKIGVINRYFVNKQLKHVHRFLNKPHLVNAAK